jgi:ureidoglycolate lyase
MPAAPRRLTAVPLTPAAFAPFGEVLAAPAAPSSPSTQGHAVIQGTARRLDRAAALESSRPAAEPNVALFRCEPQALPFRATLLERHPHSTQLFASLRGARWLLLVAPSLVDGEPDVEAARAFLASPGQGVNFRRGLWHHPVIVLDQPAELLMLAWEDGGPGDCEERPLAVPIEIADAGA